MRVPTRDILHTLAQLQPPPLVVEGAVLPEAGTDAVVLGWCRAIQSYGELLGEPFPGVQGWPCHRRGTVRKEMYTLSSCSVMSEGPTLARTEKGLPARTAYVDEVYLWLREDVPAAPSAVPARSSPGPELSPVCLRLRFGGKVFQVTRHRQSTGYSRWLYIKTGSCAGADTCGPKRLRFGGKVFQVNK